MNYIYDVLLNFSDEEIIEFYEWNDNDCLEYIKKIPLFHLSDKDFYHLKYDDITVSKAFLNRIHEATELYHDKLIKVIGYACLISNGKDVIAIEFNHLGKSIMKSTMLIDEGDEAIDIASNIKAISLDYKVEKERYINNYLTRNEKKIISLLNKEIIGIYRNKSLDKLKYLYYECFNKIGNNINNMYQELKEFINNEWNEKHMVLYHLIRLSYTKK
jgi:hypothetical protein